MARTAIAITDATTQPPSFTYTIVTMDSVNNNMFLNDGRIQLLVQNPTAGALTITIVSVADKYGRSDTAFTNVSIPASTTKIFGPFVQSVWNQLGADIGNVYVNPSSSLLAAQAIRLAAHGSTP